MRKKLLLSGIVLLLILLSVLPFARSKEKVELSDSVRAGAESGNYIQLSQGLTHYELSGPEKGKLVVLVHGFSTPYFIWDPVQKLLVSQGYKVLRFDLYGRGYSDRPDITYDIDLFRSQIQDLLNSLHIDEPFDIMGLSMGGPIVASYVAKNPENVKKVVLLDPFTAKAGIFPLTVPFLGEYLNTVIFLPTLPKGIAGDFVNPSKVPKGWVERYETQMSFYGFGKAILSTLRNLISKDPRPHFEGLASANKRVLVFWGDQDHTTPLETGAYVKDLLKSEFVLVKDCGHLPHIEQPEQVLPVISNFLSK
ncbi:alpha/beta hydrolase [Leptospira semungkisensis]|uniref:Alpha/beta hydrolase n=1 Tax=Leptospira semungkisensis TaxID=2484985 RepID=A0A4R9G5Q6_9LEPT|nr:alpha/beta hydrolase [Leptospira semungkisensis]TGK06882.1 alpha/beta hydrolase [Leptospira semungkisensis]